jgi:lysophospholipase L1-like esterase
MSGGLEIQPPLVRACSAARVEHINATQAGSEAPQISAVNQRSTRLVTVQMGGNDLGFGDILTQCWLVICNGPLVPPALMQATQARLTAVYQQILSTMRAGGTLAVLTYPAIIPRPGEPTCDAIDDHFSVAERTALDVAWVDGGEMIKRAAAAVGDPRIRVVDLYQAFDGHKICSPQGEYASAFVGFTESFHPNADGHRETARRIQQTLGLTGVVL